MTSVFLGRVDSARVAEAEAAVVALPARAGPRPFDTARGEARAAPKRLGAGGRRAGRKRAPGAPFDALVAAGLYKPEERPFWAHLTVARTRTERGKRRPRRVERPPGALPAALAEPFDAVRVSLYRSDLRPDGAKYVSLAKLDLPPSPESLGEER